MDVTTWVEVGMMGLYAGMVVVVVGEERVESIPIKAKVIFFFFGGSGAF